MCTERVITGCPSSRMVQHPHFIVEGMEAQRVGGRAQHFTGLLTPGSLLESWGWDQQALHPVPCSLPRDLEGLCDWPHGVTQSAQGEPGLRQPSGCPGQHRGPLGTQNALFVG